jgi:hypothetical protein
MRGVTNETRLHVVVDGAEGVFVGVARSLGFIAGVFFGEVRGVPALHGDHGVIGSGEVFLGANRSNPLVHSGFVGGTQLVQFVWAHSAATVMWGRVAVKRGKTNLTEN